MKLEQLINFEWYNEPENVIFLDKEMKIAARPETDFWQSLHHKIKRDNAHFFFTRLKKNFTFNVKWRMDETDSFKQCGLMVRLDERNWFKTAVMSKDVEHTEIGTCLTISGHSDWAGTFLKRPPQSIFYKIERRGDDFVCFYSLNGQKYIRLRQFYLESAEDEIKIGAYIASPQHKPFEAILDSIEFEEF